MWGRPSPKLIANDERLSADKVEPLGGQEYISIQKCRGTIIEQKGRQKHMVRRGYVIEHLVFICWLRFRTRT